MKKKYKEVEIGGPVVSIGFIKLTSPLSFRSWFFNVIGEKGYIWYVICDALRAQEGTQSF